MTKYEIKYQKTGDLKYISHLDLLRTVQRALRRAELPLKYSEGFNPHPHLVFALPLSVGIESDGELLEIALKEEMSEQEVFERIKGSMPAGLGVQRVRKIEKNNFSEISRAKYCAEPEFMPSEEEIDKFLSAEEILMEKKTKKGMKTVDIRKDIFDVYIEKGQLIMVLSAGNTANLKPSAAVAAMESILGKTLGFCRYKRLALLSDRNEEF